MPLPVQIQGFLLVGVGGFVGAVLRYAAGLATSGWSVSLPVGTLVSNLAGCLAIGVVARLAAGDFLSSEARLFLATGLCGGFTTMSSFIFELARMTRDGELWVASGYLLGTLAGCAASFALGVLLAATVVKVAS